MRFLCLKFRLQMNLKEYVISFRTCCLVLAVSHFLVRLHGEINMYSLFQVAAMAAVKHLLLAALRDLNDEELTIFKRFLWSKSERSLSQISSKLTHTASKAEIVDVMVEELGQRSVEVVFEAVKYINKTDVLMRPKTYSELQGETDRKVEYIKQEISNETFE